MIKLFFLLLIRPKKAIAGIIQAGIKLRKIIFFLFWLGILRGILEVIWIFAVSRRLTELFVRSGQLSWYIFESGPFVLANILTVYLRWAMYSLIFYLSLRLFKIRVDFSQVLKVFCFILGLYVVTILINFLHCFFNLNMVKFYIAESYSPSFGLGQAVSSCLLVWLIYNAGSRLGLDKLSSLLSALLVFGTDRIFYFFSGWIYFRLPLINSLAYKKIFYVANHLTSLMSILLTLLLLWIGYRINGQREKDI